MKRIIIPSLRLARKVFALSLVALYASSGFAATYYVATTGSDSNAGTLAAPFKSITKAQSVASSGDTVSIRGGTYSSFTIAANDSNYNYVHSISKSGITYAAYSGETPVFNFASITTAKRVCAFHIVKGVTGITIKGIQVTGVLVGSQKQSECFRIEGACAFVNVVCHDNAANGFYCTTNGSGSCTNCDSYNNIGTTSTSVGNTDGFGSHAQGVTYTYCRAWHNSDDGFDCISSTKANTYDHCWSYNNGVMVSGTGGDANGFKVGGYGLTGAVANPLPLHTVKYCLSANNGASGFYSNHMPGQAANWTYNTSYNNGIGAWETETYTPGDFNMLEQTSPTNRANVPGTREVLHYNIAYVGNIITNSNLPAANVTNNSWTKSGVTVSNADFVSLDPTQMTTARNADGSLPTITFMHLVSGSDLAGLGCF
ncbi:MAG TPA: DUF1565 domain-containing protein [Pirellulales bacterium]|nr:DUF1565 domain-containing protein [Pirellulales bacterium]